MKIIKEIKNKLIKSRISFFFITLGLVCFYFIFVTTIMARKPYLSLSSVPFFIDKLQVIFLHSNEKGKVDGFSVHFHLAHKGSYYHYTKIYNAASKNTKRKLITQRLISYGSDKQLRSFYQESFKRKEILLNTYSLKTNTYLKKKANEKPIIERDANNMLSLEKLPKKLMKKVLSKNLKTESIDFFVPHVPLIDSIKMSIKCKENKRNPYFGKKEPVFICSVLPSSRAIVALLSKDKLRNIFVLEKKFPHRIIELIIGKKHFYINKIKIIAKKRLPSILREIDRIKKKSLSL